MSTEQEILTLTALHRDGVRNTGTRLMYLRRVALVTNHRKPLIQLVPPGMTVVPDEEYDEFKAWQARREPMAA